MDLESLVTKYSKDTTGMSFAEGLFVVESYIKEEKGVHVKIDPRSINNAIVFHLYHSAFCTAFDYYCVKFHTHDT